MGATQETVAEYAAKHGVPEAVVRDIAGIPEPEPIEATAKNDSKNPAIVKVKVSGYDGPVVVDWNDRGSVFEEDDAKGLSHRYATPGARRVRLDLGGEVRWLDVEAGVDSDPEPVEVPDIPAPIGAAPDPRQVTVEEAVAEAQGAGQEATDGSGAGEEAGEAAEGSQAAPGGSE